ncbi:MAG TPA: hypothetical protein VI341_13635 [Actinomycetota bacterium]
MADNVTLPGDGSVVATDDVGGAQHQYVKVEFGADGTATPVSSADPLPVQLVDAGGDPFDVLGTGALLVSHDGSVTVEAPALDYTEGAEEASGIKGIVPMWRDGDDLLQVISVGNPLPVEIQGTPVDVNLSASSTTIGVDVETSALPNGAATLAKQDTIIGHVDGIEALLGTIDADTGNIATADAAIQTAVQIMDDWDESDRAKVNPIVGQAGVQGASGAVSATTQRVVLATDVALPAGTNNIGDVDVLTLPASTNTIEVVGDVAQDVAVAGNPVLVGMRASTAIPTAMSADGRAVHPWANRNGAQVVTTAPHIGLNSDPWNLVHETAQYTTTQTSTVLVAGGASEKIVVTKVQIQVGGTTAGTLQLYFGTGAYSRGTSRAIFDGEFKPSTTLAPGVVMDGPFIAGTNGDDLMVTDSAAINPLTITVWYYVIT